jgi:hypothetical protein
MSVAQFTLADIDRLAGSRIGTFDAPCPWCGPARRSPVNQRRRVLRVWRIDADFASYHCARCGEHGHVTERRRQGRPVDREALAPKLRENPRPMVKPQASDETRTARALQWWNEARSIRGTLAEQYLKCERGIHVLPPDVDDVLRFHPRVPFGPEYFPSMLALVRNITTDQPQAIIRTAISTCAEKLDRKALGPTRDGAVKLWPNDRVEQGLVIGEGVETVLAAASMQHRGTLLQPAWSLIDAGHIAHFPVLAGVEALTILADHDANGVGQRAAHACAEHWAEAGREAFVLTPDDLDADFNDLVWP